MGFLCYCMGQKCGGVVVRLGHLNRYRCKQPGSFWRVALQYEMLIWPLVWEARRRCIAFCLNIKRMDDKRMIRLVELEAREVWSKVKWVVDLKCSLETFGLTNEVVEKLEGLTVSEVGQMLKDCAWWEVKKVWVTEAQERSKLSVTEYYGRRV